MSERLQIEVRRDGGDYVASWRGIECRGRNPFELDSALLDAGVPRPHDLVLVGGEEDSE